MIPTIYKLSSKHWPWKWALACDYCPPLVADFKKNLPHRLYKWKSFEREWWFDDSTVEMAVSLVERHCGPVRHADYYERRSQSSHSAPTLPADLEDAYQALFLLPSAPPEVVKVAYKALSKLHHPDAGGTTGDMQAINDAYQRIVRSGKRS